MKKLVVRPFRNINVTISLAILAVLGTSCSASVIYPTSKYGNGASSGNDTSPPLPVLNDGSGGLNNSSGNSGDNSSDDENGSSSKKSDKSASTTWSRATPSTGMIFELDPQTDISNDVALDALFPNTGFSATDLRGALEDNSFDFTMEMRANVIHELPEDNKTVLDGGLSLSLSGKKQKDVSLLTEFVPDGDFELINVGKKDTMKVRFKDVENKGIYISVQASRLESPKNSGLDKKHPWHGTVSRISGGKEQKLGRFEGYLLPVKVDSKN